MTFYSAAAAAAIIGHASRTTYFPKNIANPVSLDFSFVNVYFFHIHGDNESGVLNIIETNRHLSTMQNYWLV